jgi:PAS domain S-box-containing protein
MATNPTALIVNDDPAQLRLLATTLIRDGFNALSCLSAEEALRQATEHAGVDLIVTDLYMPGIDGWRFCRLLRSSAYAAFNAIPILVVSATFTGAEAEELTAQLGADAFLPVPFEAAALRQLARALLGNTKPKKLTHVLIVAPDSDEIQSLTTAFAVSGYQVSREVSAEAASRRLQHAPPQIIVLDDALPNRGAFALLDHIRRPGSGTVTLVMLAKPTAKLALEVIRQGADNYVPKPVLPEYLLHLCETAARQRALLRVEELLEMRTRSLRESEKRYRNLFENAGDGIAIYALDGNVISVNHALETLSGASRDVFVGKHYRHILTSSVVAEAIAQQERAHAANQLSWIYESELGRADGAIVPVEVHCRFLGDDDGRPALVMAMYRDTTDRKNLERQRAEFSAMLAHDIRNPIGLILGCTELLLDDRHPPLDTQTIHKCYQRIRDDAQILGSLVNNYLDVSRIEAGQLNLTKQPVDLAVLLGKIVERYQCEAQPKSIRLEFFAEDGAVIEGDPLALERVFANLLHNACKFTPNGGEVFLTLERHGADAVVSVRDTGTGIEADNLPRLFQKFNRIETDERREGLGLGLYIVKELVAAHGGRVEVNSTVGRGACFVVSLPLAGSAEQ